MLDCVFEQVAMEDCPANAATMPECTHNVATGTLCEADQPLPDGTTTYDVNNCGAYDVFECKRGNYIGAWFKDLISPTNIFGKFGYV